MKNTIYKILGYILAGIVLIISITSIVLANTASDVEKAERAFNSTMQTHYKIEQAYLQSKENIKNYCQVLVAMKKINKVEVKSETCGLAF